MMKMIGDGFPPRRGAGTGLHWFFVNSEACGSGTPDLGLFLGVSIFIGIFGVENKLGGSTRSPQGQRARGGGV